MINDKQKIVNQLESLNVVKFVEPTASELNAKRPLMNRVQRQEDKLYHQKVLKQREDLSLRLKDLDNDPRREVNPRISFVQRVPIQNRTRLHRRERMRTFR